MFGSLPSIFKQANLKEIKLGNVLALFLTFSFSIFLLSLENAELSKYMQAEASSFAELVFAGFAMSFGVVIPGVSSTVILTLMGKYYLYLSAVASLNLSVLFPMGIGLFIGSLLLLVVLKYMFSNFRSLTYFAIVGFALGSLPVLFPTNISSPAELILGIVIMVICISLVYRLEGKSEK